MTMDIVKVVEIRKTQKPGPVRAFVDVMIGNMLVTDFRIFQDNGGRARVEVLMVTWRDPKTNELRFTPVITLPGDFIGRVQSEILSSYYREMEENGSERTK
jgi:DNA-binding cell septation regulator SpoVG